MYKGKIYVKLKLSNLLPWKKKVQDEWVKLIGQYI